MPDFTINIPIRQEDSEDVQNAFAKAYGYSDMILAGNGVFIPNPITKEQFVQQCCVNFMLNVTKNYMIKSEEISASQAASSLAAIRAAEVTQWFDNNRLQAIGGEAIYQHFPQVSNASYNLNQDSAITFTLSATDPDNLPLTFFITQQPVGGSISGTLPEVIYTPYAGYNGADIIKFKANNGTKNSLEGTIDIAINGKPIAQSQTLITNINTNINVDLLCLDPESSNLLYLITSQPSLGNLSGTAPNLVYTPNVDAVGVDSFTFNCSDGNLTSDEATVTIAIENN